MLVDDNENGRPLFGTARRRLWIAATDPSLHVLVGAFVLWHLAPAFMRIAEIIAAFVDS